MRGPAKALICAAPLIQNYRKKTVLLSVSLLVLLSSTVGVPARVSKLAGSPRSQERTATKNGTGQTTDIPVLEVGKPIERELAGGQVHAYVLSMGANQFAEVVVDQRRINVVVTASDAAGKKVIESDMSPIGDRESITLLSETPVNYRLEVRSPDNDATTGSYEIKIKELRAATERDKSLVAADALIAEGSLLRQQPESQASQEAVKKYEQAVGLAKAGKSPVHEATALCLISAAYGALGDKQNATDSANEALAVVKASPEPADPEARRLRTQVEANALEAIANVHLEFGDKKKGLDLFAQSLSLRESINDRVGCLNSLNNIGMSYGYMGDGRKALEYFEKAHLLTEELGDREGDASLLNNMGVVSSNLGEYKKALALCTRALSIRQLIRNRLGEAVVLDNLAVMHSNMGEYQEALDIHNRALALYRELQNKHGEALSLHNIAWIYGALGEYRKAIDLYNQALVIFREQGDEYRAAQTLSNIGVNYGKLGDFQAELDVELKLLPVRKKVNDQEGEAATLDRIASCYARLGDKQKASDYYEKALGIFRGRGKRRTFVTTLDNAGVFYRDAGDLQKAVEYFTEGLRFSRETGDRNTESQILADIARLERDRGNLNEAQARIEEALAAVESLRVNLKSYELRASFLATVKQFYEFDIDVLMRLHKQHPGEGFDSLALHASEKQRARTLLELLSEANAEIRRDVDASLLERERTLRQTISDKAERQVHLAANQQSDEVVRAAVKEIDDLTTEYEQVQAQIRQKSPRYAALTQPVPLDLKQIQSDLLDENTLLLEYALGDEKSYLFAVTPTSLSTFELPKRAEIESVSRGAYEILTARNRAVANETPQHRLLRLHKADAEYPKSAAALSRLLLDPVAADLKDKRLLIVGEGVLQHLPFAALPEPRPHQAVGGNPRSVNPADGSSGSGPTPLILRHEIVTLPSASVLSVLRREAAAPKSALKGIAVIADPVFSDKDPRVRGISDKGAGPAGVDAPEMREARRSAAESDLPDLMRLRFTRLEATQIKRLAPQGEVFEALDFQANRATATSPDLGRYSIIHLATHGLINNQHPELSGVVLSLVDQEGRPQNGFLRLYDIYNLRLEADLVVLSACQTALGKEIKGEGLVGLTRGFMYAGTARVVASLWQVYDRATAELMRRFYEAMLSEHLTPSAALRAAQVSMWRDKRWQQPYYWAGFALQGEWR